MDAEKAGKPNFGRSRFKPVRVQPLISYFSYMHYHIIVLHSCVVLTVFDLLERCVSLVLRLAI